MFIASGLCGSNAALGAPRKGISFVAPDGNSFIWGQKAIVSPPGKYRLCWCFGGFACTQPSEFVSYAGILRVKAPFGPIREFWCTVGMPCQITDVLGEGSNSGDRVMVMTVCGDGLGTIGFENRGVSVETAPDGSWFKLPRAVTAGRFRACWCAGETLCAAGMDYDHDLGGLMVGGPDVSAVYTCYEWEPCRILGLLGSDLHNGDRLLAVDASLNCSDPNITSKTLFGWPQAGFSSYGSRGGTTFDWGSERGLKGLRVAPGVYTLCWCGVRTAPGGVCNETAPFDAPAGQVRVGNSKEFQYTTRVEDPEERSMDPMYGILLLAPLALGATCLGILGYRKVTLINNNQVVAAPHPFPEKKAWAHQEQDRLRLQHSVKQVKAQRELAKGTVDSDGVRDDRMMELEMPNFSGKKAVTVSSLARQALADFTQAALEDKQALERNAPKKKKRQLTDEEVAEKLDKEAYISGDFNPSDFAELRREMSSGKFSSPDTFKPTGSMDSSSNSKPIGLMGRASVALFGKAGRNRGKTGSGNIRDSQDSIQVRGIQGESNRPSQIGSGYVSEESEHAQGLGPASPTADWGIGWKPDEDGPMPPSMEFDFNADENGARRDVLLKILDM